jgi:hypothetical protein
MENAMVVSELLGKIRQEKQPSGDDAVSLEDDATHSTSQSEGESS